MLRLLLPPHSVKGGDACNLPLPPPSFTYQDKIEDMFLVLFFYGTLVTILNTSFENANVIKTYQSCIMGKSLIQLSILNFTTLHLPGKQVDLACWRIQEAGPRPAREKHKAAPGN